MKIFYMFLLLAIYLLLSKCNDCEKYRNLDKTLYDNIIHNIYFMSKKETQQFFIQDKDNYVKKLKPVDIKALQAKSNQDYLQRLINISSDFTEQEKNRLRKTAQKADLFFLELNNISNEYSPEFDNIKCATMEWVFSKTIGNGNEQGMPHTRENIIFLSDNIINKSSDNELIYILIHEKVHVYQRKYKTDVQKLYKRLGFKPDSYFTDYPLARSNPDIDNIIYRNPKGQLMYAKYSTQNPTSLFDAVYPIKDDDGSEHPNEYLAYNIDHIQRKICNKDSSHKFCNLN